MTTFASPTPLDRRICLALAHLRAARYDSNPGDIARSTATMNELLDRIACRPLSVIDPELDKKLTPLQVFAKGESSAENHSPRQPQRQ